jgi:hypothetical protein
MLPNKPCDEQRHNFKLAQCGGRATLSWFDGYDRKRLVAARLRINKGSGNFLDGITDEGIFSEEHGRHWSRLTSAPLRCFKMSRPRGIIAGSGQFVGRTAISLSSGCPRSSPGSGEDRGRQVWKANAGDNHAEAQFYYPSCATRATSETLRHRLRSRF